jgi:ribosome-binding factor A
MMRSYVEPRPHRPRESKMKPEKTPRAVRKLIESLCSEPAAEDGVDPRHEARDRPSPHDRKRIQLASQIRRTLELVLAGESGEETLLALSILHVEPAPDGGDYLVYVTGPVGEAEAAAALARAAAWLRTEVAAAVHRRRAPRLTFRFVPDDEHEPASD